METIPQERKGFGWEILHAFVALFFPKTCYGCGAPLETYEDMLCTPCHVGLPLTGFAFTEENLLRTKCQAFLTVTHAATLFFFKKEGISASLIHEMKYKNNPEIGTFLGTWLGQQLLESRWHTTIDAVVPVPLHPHKQKQRGYNQSTVIGKAIASVLKKPLLENALVRIKNTRPLAHKDYEGRWKEVKDAFYGTAEIRSGATHFLLVDDVMTSGATLQACGQCLLENAKNKVSIATLAFRM